MAVPDGEGRSRIAKARKQMEARNIDALLITEASNFSYFSGQSVSPHKMRSWFMVLPLEREPVTIGYGLEQQFSRLYHYPFPSWVKDRRFYVDVPFSAETVADWGIAAVLRELGLSNRTIATELGQYSRLGMSYHDFTRLRGELPDARFTDGSSLIWRCRMVKSAWEIDAVTSACRLGGEAWELLSDELEVGMTLRDAKSLLQQLYLRVGADGGVPGIALGATGKNGTFQRGDVLYLDGGARYQGYIMDASRRFVFGKPSQRQVREHKIGCQAVSKMIEATRPGVKISSLFHVANDFFVKSGIPATNPAKRFGHGIGLENEPPSINAIDETLIEEGMILTPEPKFESVDGLVNPEETIVVTKDGCEILSKSPPIDLIVIDR